MSVYPHGTARLQLYKFSENFIFDYFCKICGKNSSFIKIRQEKLVLYVMINVHFLAYLAQFFSE